METLAQAKTPAQSGAPHTTVGDIYLTLTAAEAAFLSALYQLAMEGFFADPVYFNNRNKVSRRMVGYPGLPASCAKTVLAYRGKKVVIGPQSIADFS